VSKASREAYKNIFIVPITEGKSVPYVLSTKYKACLVRLLPASGGTGLKAGSSVRAVLELAGYENMLSKIIGSNNKLNNALTTIKALSSYKHAQYFNKVVAALTDTQADDVEDTISQ
jgi:small subunit ribosomal protein S5